MRRFLIASLVAAATLAFAVPARADTSDDQVIAERSVLTKTDMSSGFVENVAETGDENFSGEAACRGVNKSVKALNDAPNREVEFESAAQRMLINNKVSVFSSAAKAKSAFAGYSNAAACLKASSRKEVGVNAKIKVSRSTVDYGDQAVEYTVTLSEGNEASYITIEVTRVGRAFAGLLFLRDKNPIPSDTVAGLTGVVVSRLESAL